MCDNGKSLTLTFLSLLFIMLAAAAATAPNAFAASTVATTNPASAPFDEEDDAGYEETARVVRISLLSGDVSLRRAGSKNWERATLNLPLVEGDRLATGAGARLEIQIDARNFIRIGEYATLDFITLREEGIALSLPEGTATLRLARFDNDREYFEIDAPKTTLAAEREGLYRLDVSQSGNVRATVRDGGRARLYSETSGFTLRDGRAAELVANNSVEDGDWELSAARSANDDWDTWVNERESYLASRLRHDRRDRYYDNYVWGAEELDVYGDWVNTGEYGYVWRPHVTVINQYNNWAPYRYGSWRWCPPYGWTWVGDEPWGWAPYHYGRWVHVNNYWCWAPRGHADYGRRSWWRPALVAFISFGGGSGYDDHYAWYPLGYHQRDPRSNYYRRAVNRAREQQRLAGLGRLNPIYQRAVTTLPAREFGKGLRARPATKELAARALTIEPVRGRLPLRPVEADLATAGGGGGGRSQTPGLLRERDGSSRRGDTLVIRNPASNPTRAFVERKTGAASRKPGLALDEELRRGRIYNNREPRKIEKTFDGAGGGDTRSGDGTGGERGNGRNPERTTSGDNNRGERGTGAVTRPARPIRIPDTRDGISGDGSSGGMNDGNPTGMPAMKRPIRQADPDTETLRPRPEVRDGERPERKVKPATRPDDNTVMTPPDAPRRELPAPEVYRPRPEPREERPREERKTERIARPSPREERSVPREERPAPREERSAPPPPPREERSAPPPREERRPDPPQREEKRADPPRQREDSPVRQKTRPIDND